VKNIAVIGLPRSGTSVMWHVLAQDPEIEQALYEPLRESVLVPGAIEETWCGNLDEQRNVIAASYSPAFQFMPLTIPEGTFVDPLTGYLADLFALGTTCVKLIQIPLRAEAFFRRFGHIFKVVWIVRSPFQFAASMMPNPDAWTDQALRDWMGTFELAGIGDAATFDTIYRLKQQHPYVRMLNVWGLHVRHMLGIQAGPESNIVRVRLEDFAVDPVEGLLRVYGVSDMPPREVVERTDAPGEPSDCKWRRAVSADNIQAHKPWPRERWKIAVELAGIEDILPRMGYPIP
jgi:hypothetical protein